MAALLTADRRDLSRAACMSFELMRQSRLNTASAFDARFVESGFGCLE
jgi:hypothetical protein